MEKFDSRLALECISAGSITHGQFVPAMFAECSNCPRDRRQYRLTQLETGRAMPRRRVPSTSEADDRLGGPILDEYYAPPRRRVRRSSRRGVVAHRDSGPYVVGVPHFAADGNRVAQARSAKSLRRRIFFE